MLEGFSVGNYRSFKTQQNFSMMAGKTARHKDHVTAAGNRKLLKSALVFGANAGGKSNFIKAIDFSQKIIINGLDSVSLDKKHFRISEDMYAQPGYFEYTIIADGTEYCYGLVISYNRKIILAEWLTRIEENGNEVCIFNREMDESGISHTETEVTYKNQNENFRMEVYLDDFGKDISDLLKKKTILSDIAGRVSRKNKIFKDIVSVHEWFSNISVIFPDSEYSLLNFITTDEKIRSFFGGMMSYFDTGIESIQNQVQELEFDRILQNMPADEAEKLKARLSNNANEENLVMRINQKMYILYKNENGSYVYDKMMLNHGNAEDLFEYQDESDGTRRLFEMIPVLFQNSRKSLILIDEIDRSFHTNLTKRFLQMSYRALAQSSCQLIVTTQDSNLLDLDLLRQDEIWFVERKPDHSSELYSMSRFKERFEKDTDKEYLIGRYGAIPAFDESVFSLEVPDAE